MKPPKIYILAGEASGDLHGSNLLAALMLQVPDLEVRFWGGDRMESLAGKPVKHIRELAFMGFAEVLANLRTIVRNIKLCKEDIRDFQPDVLLLIDYPGFNLRIAEWAKKEGFRVDYYISPQIWAWKSSRVYKIKKSVDRMMVILPFESEFYARFGYSVNFVGHPLLDEVEKQQKHFPNLSQFQKKNDLLQLPIIAILPGSRKQEIATKLPKMLAAAKNFPNYQIVVAGAPSLSVSVYSPYLEHNTKVIFNQTYTILHHATAALVTSGTATLETALLKCPQVVCYIGNSLSYAIAKRLVKINFISLVNLIMDEEVVTELIQKECNTKRIAEELKKILPGGNKRESISLKYEELIQKLGQSGASAEAARLIASDLRNAKTK